MTPQGIVSTAEDKAPFLAARNNPLCVDLVTRIKYRFAIRDWNWQLARLKELNFRAAIVGPHGSGKTTLLFELLDLLHGSDIPCHHVFVPQNRRDHPTLLNQAIENSRANSILLVDGMERLSLRQRWELIRVTTNGPGLVANLHRAHWFPPRLPTWIWTTTSPDLMSQILKDLDLDTPEIQVAGAAAFAKSNGNIRDALRDLYDQFSSGRFNEILSG